MNNYNKSYSAITRIKEELINSFFGVETEHLTINERNRILYVSNEIDELAEIFNNKALLFHNKEEDE